MEEDYYLKGYKEEKARQEENIKLYNELLKDLRTNGKYKEFFSQFRAESIESFITSYAREKMSCINYGPMYLKNEEYFATKYKEAAENCLWQIQQKKLFNLQCLWRAEQIELEEIQCTNDFDYWSKFIKSCPFLSPITRSEFELYVSFLKTDATDYNYNYYDWQNYSEIKEEYFEEGSEFFATPEWYKYFDNHMGTFSLLSLPDIRGEKEEFYMEKSRQALRGKNESIVAAEELPYLHGDDATMEKFVRKFEDKTFLKYYKAMKNGREKGWENSDIDELLEILKEANESFPMEPHTDWREAIRITAEKYKVYAIMQCMETAYEDYLFRLENKIRFETPEEEEIRIKAKDDESYTFLRNFILDGRELNNEPRNFDF